MVQILEGFDQPISDCVANEDRQAVFRALVNPSDAEVKWYFNNELIDPDQERVQITKQESHAELKIANITAADAGTYAVEVQTEKKPKSLARLLYKKEANFITTIQNQNVDVGAELSFECQVSPNDATVRWFHNDLELTEGDFTITAEEGVRRLAFASYSERESGSYFVKIEDTDTLYCNDPLRIALVNTHNAQEPEAEEAKDFFGIADCTAKVGSDARLVCKLQTSSKFVTWYKAEQCDNAWPTDVVTASDRTLIESNDDNTVYTLTVKSCALADEGNYFVKIGESGKSYLVYSGSLKITGGEQKSKSILKRQSSLTDFGFIDTVNQVTAAVKESATFTCSVEPHDAQVTWFSGNAKLKDSLKYEITSKGHRRSLTVKDCHDLDQGQYMVQIQDMDGRTCADRLRIAHLRVGTASPQDLLMRWAQQMKKCNEIMTEMAACQKVYEDKARCAEEKLEDWKKGNRKTKGTKDGRSEKYQEGRKSVNGGENGYENGYSDEEEEPVVKRQKRPDGKDVLVDATGKPVTDDQGREIFVDEDGNEYVEEADGKRSYEVKSSQLEKLEKEEDVRRTARAAVARTSGAVNGNGMSRSSRSVTKASILGGSNTPPRVSMDDRASKFGGRMSRSKSRSRKSSLGDVGAPMITTAVEAKLIEACNSEFPPPEFDPDMPEDERKMKMMLYEIRLKDLINSKLQKKLNDVMGQMNKAIGGVSAWQYDRMGL